MNRRYMPEWMKKSLYGIVFILLGLYVTILIFPVESEQQPTYHPLSFTPTPKLIDLQDSFNLDSLINLVGPNKHLPEGYELQALLALSAYPELKSIEITFNLNETSAALEANFKLWSMFGKKENRHYEILINVSNDGFLEPIKLHNLPFDAQVAILAHELGHVRYYHRLNLLQIANWGIQYLINPNYRGRHERSTDLAPVWRGLGYQIQYYAWYVRNSEKTKALYNKMGSLADKFYMNDRELKAEMDKLEIYP